MEGWCFVKHKSSLMLSIFLVFMFGWAHQGISIKENEIKALLERKALLEIKASLVEVSKYYNNLLLLPSWVVDNGSNYCDWERINCNSTSSFVDDNYKYVTDLSLGGMLFIDDNDYDFYFEIGRHRSTMWPLNISIFLNFKELRRLDLSWNYIGNTFVTSGLERLSGLKKLENLNLNNNFIETNNIFPLLSQLTSLKVLDLSFINGYQGYSPTHDISEFRIPENMEVLDLTGCGFYGTLRSQDSETASNLRKLKILNIGWNRFNESLASSLSALTSLNSLDLQNNLLSGSFSSQDCKSLRRLEKLETLSLGANNFNKSIISCLSFLPSLKTLDLRRNEEIGTGSYPMEELSSLRELKTLDMSYCGLQSIAFNDCKTLTRLEKLESVSLSGNNFNKSIISCLSFLPSLNTLDLSASCEFGASSQDLSLLRELKILDLSYCGLQSITFNGTMSKLVHLNLDWNAFFSVDDVMRSMAAAFPSLRFLSLGNCDMGGRLLANGAPYIPYLKALILSRNNLNGTLPIEALASFHHLEILDLSYNNFIGGIPSVINSLASLKVVSFAGNALNGSLKNDGFCKLKNLHELDLSSNIFDGKLPECFNRLSSLQLFDISSNQLTGVLLSSVITNLTSLKYVDFRSNKFEGSFSLSWFSNLTELKYFAFASDNDDFDVETEEPVGWTCMFQLEVLILSSCNINRYKGSVIPSFLLHQHKLRELDMSYNSLKGQFPNWLIKNNTMLSILHLRDNSFDGTIYTSSYRNRNIRWLDVSGSHMIDPIPNDTQKSLPYIYHLNLSRNSIDGVIPSSIGDLIQLHELDLSHNRLSGEVPIGLLTNPFDLSLLILSNNSFHGEILSQNFNFCGLSVLQLGNNCFTGKFRNPSAFYGLKILDISNNFFTSWISDDLNNISMLTPNIWFLDLSKNYFSGSIHFFLSNFRMTNYIHLGSNKFTGSIHNSFRNLTEVLTLDISNNYLSGRIPHFLGELSNLRILLLGKNNFSGSIPRQLCHLTNVNLIDLSNNLLSGSIPRCLQNIAHPSYPAFMQNNNLSYDSTYFSAYQYNNGLDKQTYFKPYGPFIIPSEILFTTKTLSMVYKGDVLDIMSGLDLSCNKLRGNIPEELGLLAQIHALNLSHNRLTGPIPVKFSNLANLESLDLSFNSLTGRVPPELIKLNSLEVFNVSFNNLSGRLPEIKAQFGTFAKESYEGNPLLCGLPLENECITESHGTQFSNEEGSDEKWYDMDMVSFYGSCSSTWFVFILGFVVVLYVNRYLRRWWFHMVEESMHTSFYFIYDLVRKLFMPLFM